MISFLSNRFWGEDLLFIACPTHRFLPAGINLNDKKGKRIA